MLRQHASTLALRCLLLQNRADAHADYIAQLQSRLLQSRDYIAQLQRGTVGA